MRKRKTKSWRYYERQGYIVKRGRPGWWVDGACGFGVAYYYDTKRKAINEAKRNIEAAIRNHEQPSWRFV